MSEPGFTGSAEPDREPEPVTERLPETTAPMSAYAADPEPGADPDPDLYPDPDPDPAAPEPDPAAEPAGSAPHRARLAFRRWRRSRPFWGGFLVVLGGAEITFTEKAPFEVVVHVGLYGLAGYLLPVILVLCGFLTLFNPQQRTFYSVLSVLLSLGTWLTSNLGGFLIGMLLGIIGGSLAFGWAPGERPPRKPLFGRKPVSSGPTS